jgi:serine/threonine-protein kinase
MNAMTDKRKINGPLSNHTIGKYRIQELIARGGMGDVYLALDNIDREVAFKVLHPGYEKDSIARFQNEAKTLAKYFSHPNILKLYEFFEFTLDDGSETHAIVTEYINGKTLRDIMYWKDKGIPDDFFFMVLRQICSALETPHDDNIIHRDIKPENIMISRTGKVVLMDFGIVKQLDGASNMTKTGVLTGTPQYSAPEQLLKLIPGSDEDSQLYPATDIFPLGTILYEIATGYHPFAQKPGMGTADQFTVLSRIMKLDYLPPEKINKDLDKNIERIIKTCLRKKPKQRYQNAREIGKEFDTLLAEFQATTDNFSIEKYLANWMQKIMAPDFPDNLVEADLIKPTRKVSPTNLEASMKRQQIILFVGLLIVFLAVGFFILTEFSNLF